jgi:hypothetical protein
MILTLCPFYQNIWCFFPHHTKTGWSIYFDVRTEKRKQRVDSTEFEPVTPSSKDTEGVCLSVKRSDPEYLYINDLA